MITRKLWNLSTFFSVYVSIHPLFMNVFQKWKYVVNFPGVFGFFLSYDIWVMAKRSNLLMHPLIPLCCRFYLSYRKTRKTHWVFTRHEVENPFNYYNKTPTSFFGKSIFILFLLLLGHSSTTFRKSDTMGLLR